MNMKKMGYLAGKETPDSNKKFCFIFWLNVCIGFAYQRWVLPYQRCSILVCVGSGDKAGAA